MVPGSLGIVWNASPSSSPLKLPIVLKNDIWSHIVVIFKKSGNIEVCQDGIYLGKVNLNYELPKVNFDNFRMGGFCGMVDDLKIYDYTLDYEMCR